MTSQHVIDFWGHLFSLKFCESQLLYPLQLWFSYWRSAVQLQSLHWVRSKNSFIVLTLSLSSLLLESCIWCSFFIASFFAFLLFSPVLSLYSSKMIDLSKENTTVWLRFRDPAMRFKNLRINCKIHLINSGRRRWRLSNYRF